MARCTKCGGEVSLFDRVTVADTVLGSPIFYQPPMTRWPVGNGKAACDECAILMTIEIAEHMGANQCTICHKPARACFFPFWGQFLGLWRRGSQGLEFDCIDCSKARKVMPERRSGWGIDNDGATPQRHPWQDYADDDPNFWDNLRD